MAREQQHIGNLIPSMAKAAVEIDFGLTLEGMLNCLDDTLPDEIVLAELRRRDIGNAPD